VGIISRMFRNVAISESRVYDGVARMSGARSGAAGS
jgi:hypothetical protein